MSAKKLNQRIDDHLSKALSATVDHKWAVDKAQKAAEEKNFEATEKRNGFPLRPSSALKTMRDLYYGLENWAHPGTIPVTKMDGRVSMLLGLGHLIERHVVYNLKQAGFTILYENHRVTYGELADGTELSGEFDFCIETKEGELVICDSKSIGDYGFNRTQLPKLEHIAQINLYMHSDWARKKNINRAIVVYYSKNNSDMKMREFQYSPELAEDVIARFQLVYDMWKRKELPPREKVFGLDWEAKYSNFVDHDMAEFNVPEEDRERDTVECLPEDKKDVIRQICIEHGSKVVYNKEDGQDYWLVVGKTGLLLKTRR